ncbi:5-hydroxyisourate hydrolase [Vulcanimicrobium alpinum]|uniref:5-hydroxyisourate hydrolase n=1 Tax=Vulcanimicrobium alpinum TaxID=3016050 RepID=A0AAN1XYK9_UNVUL|nr:hydroxyisourate hydrolase [Vulcanimicrobium alpinum]BDE07758.1 5-hydroxyisourate hydrolase [Vulcanimicrobium alpinum]
MLSTHVLDLARGVPAPGISVALHRLFGEHRMHVASAVTDADGRAGMPEPLEAGTYELVFTAGPYVRARGDVPFYDEIPVRFSVDATAERYHVPLLLSPFGYTTYRGS